MAKIDRDAQQVKGNRNKVNWSKRAMNSSSTRFQSARRSLL